MPEIIVPSGQGWEVCLEAELSVEVISLLGKILFGEAKGNRKVEDKKN